MYCVHVSFFFSTTPSRKRRKRSQHVSVDVRGPKIKILKSGKMLTDRQTCEPSLSNNQESYEGFGKRPEVSATEGIQAS